MTRTMAKAKSDASKRREQLARELIADEESAKKSSSAKQPRPKNKQQKKAKITLDEEVTFDSLSGAVVWPV